MATAPVSTMALEKAGMGKQGEVLDGACHEDGIKQEKAAQSLPSLCAVSASLTGNGLVSVGIPWRWK